MKVLFLCGGVGKRMLPVTGDKCLLKFLGKTLLEHHIEKALATGLAEFVLVGNRGNIDRLKDIAGKFPQAEISLAVQEPPSGIAGAVRSAQRLVADEVIVVNPGDAFEESAYAAMLEAGQTGVALSYILGTRVDGYFPGGYLVVNNEKQIIHIVEKPERGKQPSDLVNIVLHYHRDTQALLPRLAKTKGPHAYERALDSMMRQGYKFELVEYYGSWVPIKYPWHILAAMEYFVAQSPGSIAPSADISERATIDTSYGGVAIDENVRVMENAIIRGPCYIGKNSVIGNNVLIREGCHIGDDCVVGFSTEVRHSYIGDGCWFHSNYIGDSIIGDRCSFGAGTVTANLRFDEGEVKVYNGSRPLATGTDKLGAIIGADSKTGVNVSIMPGVRIGPNSVVGPHVLLRHDLGPNREVLAGKSNRIVKRKSVPAGSERRQI